MYRICSDGSMSKAEGNVVCHLDHDAFVYGSEDEYTATLGPLLSGALDKDQTVIAVVSGRNADLLGACLGNATQGIEFFSAEEWYSRPICAIEAYRARLAAVVPGSRACVVGEVQFGDDETDWVDWTRYEATLNEVFGGHDVRIICPYDRRVLSDSVVQTAERTHPHLLNGAGCRPSERYERPQNLVMTLGSTVDVPGRPPDLVIELPATLYGIRRAFTEVALAAGFSAERVTDLTLAFNEVATNALKHMDRAGSVHVWMASGALACVVRDDGRGVDPLVGFERPSLGSESGYGVWLARRLFDRLDVRTDSSGTEVLLSTGKVSSLG